MNGDSSETLLIIVAPIAVVLLVAVVIPMLLRPLNRKADRLEYKARAGVRQKLSGSKPATADGGSIQAPHESKLAAAAATAASSASSSATDGPRRQIGWRAIWVAGAAIVVLGVPSLGPESFPLLLIVLVAVGIGIYISRDLKRQKEPTKIQIAEPATATAANVTPAAATEPVATLTAPTSLPATEARAPTTLGNTSPAQMQIERVEVGSDDTLVRSLGIDIVNDGVPVAGPAETGEEFVSAIVSMGNVTLIPDRFDAGEAIAGGSASVTFTQHRVFGVMWDIKGTNATTYSTDAGSGSVLAFSAPRGAFTASQFGRMRAGLTGHATYESMTVQGTSSLSGEPLLLFDLDEGAFNRSAHGGIRLVVEAFTEGLPMPNHDTVRNQL